MYLDLVCTLDAEGSSLGLFRVSEAAPPARPGAMSFSHAIGPLSIAPNHKVSYIRV